MCIYIYVGMWMKIGTGVFSFVASYSVYVSRTRTQLAFILFS